MTKVLAALVAALASTAATAQSRTELQTEFERLTAEFQQKLRETASGLVAEYEQQWAAVSAKHGLDAPASVPELSRRRLATDLDSIDTSSYTGIEILYQSSKIALGEDADVHILRHGDSALGVIAETTTFAGNVNVSDNLIVNGADILATVDAVQDLQQDLADCKASVDMLLYTNCPTKSIMSCSNGTSPVMETCCDDGSWRTVYTLDIEESLTNYDSYDDVPYTSDNSGDIADGSFKRIAYHLTLDDEWVFVSMNAFTNKAALTGIPVDWDHDYEDITGLSVLSNSPALANITGMTQGQGTIEFWSNCYGTGDGSVYDNSDVISDEDCYGSFQVHAQDGTTVFAYNAWSSSGRGGDLGIGDHLGSEHLDWTFADNAGDYDVKTLTVLVSDTAGAWVPNIDRVNYVDSLAEAQMETQDIVQDLVDAPQCPITMAAACSNSSDTFQMQNCCHSGGWQLVYDLDIEDSANYDVASDIPYTTDNSGDIGSFRRVAYHLQLDDEWVFVSMNAYTTDAGLIGIPVDWDHQLEGITGLTITSNAAALENTTGLAFGTGSIEFWSNCYGTGALDLYDNSDVISSDDCYGSFQVHTEDGGTVFAYNAWSHSSYNDLGIGNYGGDHPDWTFADTASNYAIKNLKVFINEDVGVQIPRIDDLEGPAFCKPSNELEANCKNADDLFKMSNCCDGGGWELAYQLEIEDSADYNDNSDVPYSIDRSDHFSVGSFRKIAYHLQLDDEFVFVSMNAFTSDPEKTGIPVDYDHDFDVIHSVNVMSNAASLHNYTGTLDEDGEIEMWSNCYGTGSDGVYSNGDTISTSDDCYGSFQVHLSDGSTVFAYNGWSHSSYNDLGIGNQQGTHSDWTFADNAASYDVKTLTVYLLRY